MTHDALDPVQAAHKVELIVAQLDALPTLPRIATQLLRLTQSDRAGVREAVELIKQDQAVTAKILSLAARAGSGIRGETATIDKCVKLMGLEAVRNAALSIKVFEAFDPRSAGALPGQRFDLAEFWKHSLAVGLASELLATRLLRGRCRPGHSVPPPDELFVAGLLHDIGKAALHHCLPKSYGKVLEAAETSHAPLAALERRLIGVDHMVVGKRLAQRWALPAGVIDTIWLHHSPPAALPDSIRQRGFVPVVQLADVIAREMRLGHSGNYPRSAGSDELAEAMGLSADDLESVRRALPEELAARASLIGIDKLDSRDLYYEALSGANEELARMNARWASRGQSLLAKAKYFDLLGEFSQRLRVGARPIEVVELIGALFAPLLGERRAVIFSEPPLSADGPAGPAALIEGVVLDGPDRVAERFVLPAGGEASGGIEGLSAGRCAGWLDPARWAGGFALVGLQGRLGWVHSRLEQPLPLGPTWLAPLLGGGECVGGLVFTAEADSPDAVARWHDSRAELLALASAAGLALRAAQAAAERERLAEDLVRSADQLAQTQDDLTRQRTLASIGQMAAGAGHELNNPLSVISGRSELLAADEQDPARREALEQIRANAARASGIISELMVFAQPPEAHPQAIDLPALAETLARPLEQAAIDVAVTAEADLPAAWADPAQLAEVVQEVLDNAQQAMAAQDAGRRLSLRLSRSPLSPDRELELAVQDNGVGMAPAVLAHATDPFFSARPAGRGRGLGLARARRLIEHNGGSLALESQVGAGALVRIRLPVAPAE